MTAEMVPKRVLLLWGKLSRDRERPLAYHPLICHTLDTAAVAQLLWREVLTAAARMRVSQRLDIDEVEAARQVSFWAALHDLGKCSPSFQAIDSSWKARLETAGYRCTGAEKKAHAIITASTIPELLADKGYPGRVVSGLATMLGGHHGVFPASGDVISVSDSTKGQGLWAESREYVTGTLVQILRAGPVGESASLDNPTAMFLAGLVSVADWIASNEEFFGFAVENLQCLPEIDAQEYFDESRSRARDALHRLGWLGWAPSKDNPSFRAEFPEITAPRPVQEATEMLADTLAGPCLVAIEVPTGEGKSEAAMYLADRFGCAYGLRGCYFALPTQATSDQMFSRVHEFLARRYPANVVNLQLLHGHAALSAAFEELRQEGNRLFELGENYGEQGYDGAPAGVVASEWFTHRKRGLLAPFGVGTIDQSLLAALQTRHVFVRLFGLAHKTVILDEVHAYDVYMSKLLERLLEWLGALGTSVVLLSATLPCQRARLLAQAYVKGLGGRLEELHLDRYPRLTWVTKSGSGSQHVETSEINRRTLDVKWVDGSLPGADGGEFALGKRLQKTLQDGGCAVVICNTVHRAQKMYQALKRYFTGLCNDGYPQLDLLHARFPFEERYRREKRCLVRFGKPGARVIGADGQEVTVSRPERAVLVATQIVEQSLDLDFDLMVTDLAPVDLLLQRAGRLHRHLRQRPRGLENPTLWVFAPEIDDDGVPDFAKAKDDRFVYEPHVLLRSWLEMKDRNHVRVPEEVEELIEAVYGEDRHPEGLSEALVERWRATWEEHQNEVRGETAQAVERCIPSPSFCGSLWNLAKDPREEDAPDLHQAHQALTRLSEPTVEVVCLYGTADRAFLDPEGKVPVKTSAKPDHETAMILLGRSVRVAGRGIVEELLNMPAQSGWKRSPLLRHHRLIALDSNGEALVGSYRVKLDPEIGLTFSKQRMCKEL